MKMMPSADRSYLLSHPHRVPLAIGSAVRSVDPGCKTGADKDVGKGAKPAKNRIRQHDLITGYKKIPLDAPA